MVPTIRATPLKSPTRLLRWIGSSGAVSVPSSCTIIINKTLPSFIRTYVWKGTKHKQSTNTIKQFGHYLVPFYSFLVFHIHLLSNACRVTHLSSGIRQMFQSHFSTHYVLFFIVIAKNVYFTFDIYIHMSHVYNKVSGNQILIHH